MSLKFSILILFSLFLFKNVISQSCDCDIFPIKDTCKKKCGIKLLQIGTKEQLKTSFNLDKETAQKIANVPNRKNKKSVKDFRHSIPEPTYKKLKISYDKWQRITVDQHNIFGDNVAGNKIVNNNNYINDDVKRLIDEKAKYQKILITPTEVFVPAHGSKNVPIVITNNYPYPVFMVVVVLAVQEGDINLTEDVVPFGSGLWQTKYLSCQIPQINSGASITIDRNFDGSKYANSSTIKISVDGYFKEPVSDFFLHNVDTIPKTLQIGKVPEYQHNF